MEDVFLLLVAEREEFLQHARAHRMLRDNNNPFHIPEALFLKMYRLPAPLVLELIESIEPLIDRRRRHGIPTHVKVLVTLNLLATGSYQQGVGINMTHPISQPSVSAVVHGVVDAMERQVLDRYIKFPLTQAEREAVAAEFLLHRGMPDCIGAIDCTHVSIYPPRNNKEAYLDHNRRYSLNVEMVCDHHLLILAVDASFPGRVHDSYIFNQSQVKAEMQRLAQLRLPFYIIGDSGYAQEPYLMTPVRNAEPGTAEHRYTMAQCRARNCIERCFGVLKAIWRCLRSDRVLHYSPAFAGQIVNVCAILHNIRIRNGVPFPEDVNDLDVVEEARQHGNAQLQAEGPARLAGYRARAELIRRHFA